MVNESGKTEIIVGIVIFICIFVFIVIAVFASGVSDYTPQQTITPTTTGLFLSPCNQQSNDQCLNGLICDGVDFTCRLPEGSVCNNYSDCASGLVCSGICTPGPVGSLDQPCPCNPGFFCKIDEGSLNLCKFGPGSFCNTNNDCFSGNCVGTPNGICSAQPPPIINPTQGLLLICSNGPESTTNNSCIGGTVCYGQTGGICQSDLGCSCLFPYNNPNNPVDDKCIGGMSNINNKCLNNIGLPCGSSSNCSTLSCNGNSSVVGYSFNTQNGPSLPNGINFLGSTNTSINVLFPGPSGLINPYKMFSYSISTTDTIYLVDHNLGLLTLTYDVITKVYTQWITLIPYITTTSTTTRKLIDACIYSKISPIQLLVAFSETVTVSGSTYSTVYVYDLSSSSLTPFNFQSGSGISGTQYKSNNNPISINYIDVSSQIDVLLVESGTVYLKIDGQTKYSIPMVVGGPNNGNQITNTFGPVYFYLDSGGTSSTNIAFVGSFPVTLNNVTTILPQILQFSGSIAGTAFPFDPFGDIKYNVFDYSIYSPGAMNQSSISFLTSSTVDNIVALLYMGLRTFFPLKMTTNFRSVTTHNSFYILGVASCT